MPGSPDRQRRPPPSGGGAQRSLRSNQRGGAGQWGPALVRHRQNPGGAPRAGAAALSSRAHLPATGLCPHRSSLAGRPLGEPAWTRSRAPGPGTADAAEGPGGAHRSWPWRCRRRAPLSAQQRSGGELSALAGGKPWPCRRTDAADPGRCPPAGATAALAGGAVDRRGTVHSEREGVALVRSGGWPVPPAPGSPRADDQAGGTHPVAGGS